MQRASPRARPARVCRVREQPGGAVAARGTGQLRCCGWVRWLQDRAVCRVMRLRWTLPLCPPVCWYVRPSAIGHAALYGKSWA